MTFILQSSNADKIFTVQAADVVERWRRVFGIDVDRFFINQHYVSLYLCKQSKIGFFEPAPLGDREFYSELQKIDWYYLRDKWEFGKALSNAAKGERILEVGCGDGAFLAIAAAQEHKASGLELNSEAAAQARASGLDVSETDLFDLAASGCEPFDRVVAFQVLEHVRDPVAFTRAMMACAKPGGRVAVAVPNAESFISWEPRNLLDMPPHHATRWTPAALRWLGAHLGAAHVEVQPGPLEPIHVDWFLSLMFRNRRLKRTVGKLARPLLRRCLHAGARRLISGHTIYAEYTVPAS